MYDNRVVARSHNLTESLQTPLAHAEILCLQQAAEILDAWRLLDATLYVTLEPCAMCAGAVLQARLRCLVYGARSLRLGMPGLSWGGVCILDQHVPHMSRCRACAGADGSWIPLLPGSRRDGISAPRHPFHPNLQVSQCACLQTLSPIADHQEHIRPSQQLHQTSVHQRWIAYAGCGSPLCLLRQPSSASVVS